MTDSTAPIHIHIGEPTYKDQTCYFWGVNPSPPLSPTSSCNACKDRKGKDSPTVSFSPSPPLPYSSFYLPITHTDPRLKALTYLVLPVSLTSV
ncbi:hypothetical protein E2C01_046740 [Portunus trituberculatus]|uniref:Uncharacterized protein n=1 Tax=Portunus trituberculatus TaxID=210409 RepID=A0A5B7FZC4_PORTR|nr:hypothetical protein [Portunus trituberculatus]